MGSSERVEVWIPGNDSILEPQSTCVIINVHKWHAMYLNGENPSTGNSL